MTLEIGDYVENIHWANRGRMPIGLVLGAPNDLDQVSVKTGSGSHVYGPAINWVKTDTKPDWLEAI